MMHRPIACNSSQFKTAIGGGSGNVSEYTEKAELVRRRKLRLEQVNDAHCMQTTCVSNGKNPINCAQVRQRSKDFAADLRKKVHDEKNRQMQQYNATKSNELRTWKQNQIKQTQTLYETNLAKIGDAHLAARNEIAVDAKIVEKKRQNAIVAKRRGINAMTKLHAQTARTGQRGNVFVRTAAGTKVDAVGTTATQSAAQRDRQNDEPAGKLSQTVTEFVEISSDDDELSSSMEIHATAAKVSNTLPLVYTNQPNPYTLATDNLPPTESSSSSCAIVSQTNDGTAATYNPQQFAVNDSADCVIEQPEQSCERELPFTQISQFLSSRRKESTVTSDVRMTDGSVGGSSLLKPPPPPPVVKPVNHRPTTHVRQVVSRSKPMPPRRTSPVKPNARQYVPLFGQAATIKSTITADSSANILRPESTQRVKFYDHANRFAKEYRPAPNIVQRIERDPNAATAADVAVEETKFDDLKLEYLNELKKKAEIRSQQCLEKEHMRKDYEKMMVQLEELSKRQQYAQMYTDPHPSCATYAKQNDELQRKLNECVEREFIHKPIPITCPRFTNDVDSGGFNLARNGDGPLGTHLNSSDSANSIHLGPSADEPTKSTVQPKKTTVHPRSSNKENVQIAEQQQLLTQEKENLELLVQRMKAKEKSLERKAKKMFLAEMMRKKRADKANQTKSVRIQDVEIQTDNIRTVGTETAKNEKGIGDISPNDTDSTWQSASTTMSSSSSPPVKIIIKVNGRRAKDRRSKSSPRKPVSVHVKQDSETDRKVYPKTPVKPTKKVVVDDIEPATADANRRKSDEQLSSTSTVYKALPPFIQTELSPVIEPVKLPKKVATAMHGSNSIDKPTNPMLRHYITRLLGMSRTSIEQLGVSSSTSIETPADSIVNITGNLSTITDVNERSVDDERLTKLQKFILDNHSLLNEMERAVHRAAVNETARHRTPNDAVGKVWVDALQQNACRARKVKAGSIAERNKTVPKPILKNVVAEPSSVQQQQQQHVPAGGSDDEARMTQLYAQLTENCNQRFAELNEKINKVRREKQKLLEGTLSPAPVQQPATSRSGSSSSDRDMPSSEYCSFKLKTLLADESCDSSARQAMKKHANADAQMRLSQSINIGLSRDSGICTSRPVTSSDMRDSPDIRTIKFDQKQPADNGAKQMDGNAGPLTVTDVTAKTFEPLLKDIPKYYVEDLHEKLEDGCDADGAAGRIGVQKRTGAKPPTSLKRYVCRILENIIGLKRESLHACDHKGNHWE